VTDKERIGNDVCDVRRLDTWIRAELGVRREASLVGSASGGSSNITLFVDVGAEHWVLRRPPLGDVLPTAHDVVREYRYIEAVHGAGIPVAEPIGVCTDSEVIGAPFSLFRRVPGLVMSDPASECLADPVSAARVTRSMIGVLARLHAVDWRAIGLEARSGEYLQRQVRRWTRQLELTPSASRLGTRLDEITAWVQANVPQSARQTIVHGDYSLNNVIVSWPPSATVAAVLDWEMATIGDPVTDVVWLLRGWGRDTQPSNWIASRPGALTPDEAVEAYERASGTSIGDRTFYEAFCAWKGVVILEGLYAAWLAGTASTPRAAGFEAAVPEAVDELHQRLSCLS
jgi:aminoglycoside phosphotransferase (APT) family kinase protein